MADARLHELAGTQDFHAFVSTYRDLFPDDVLTIRQPLSADQDVTALVAELAARGRHEMLVCEQVDGLDTPLVTNVFASRSRIARLFGVEPPHLFEAYQRRANAPLAPRIVANGPVLDRPRPLHYQRGDRRRRSGDGHRQPQLPPFHAPSAQCTRHQPALTRPPLADAAKRAATRRRAPRRDGDWCSSTVHAGRFRTGTVRDG
jgi:hypothetical protein